MNNYSWRQWEKLPWNERAEAVAFYRVRLLLDLHRNDAVNREMKRRNRSKE